MSASSSSSGNSTALVTVTTQPPIASPVNHSAIRIEQREDCSVLRIIQAALVGLAFAGAAATVKASPVGIVGSAILGASAIPLASRVKRMRASPASLAPEGATKTSTANKQMRASPASLTSEESTKSSTAKKQMSREEALKLFDLTQKEATDLSLIEARYRERIARITPRTPLPSSIMKQAIDDLLDDIKRAYDVLKNQVNRR